MEAIRRGAGDAFILGCNHPLWPSLGLIHGSRSSMDVGRSWKSFSKIGRENLYRAWQNGRLWWNDPDCVVLTGNQPENEFLFHATLCYATGGMLLSGDDLTKIPPERLAILRKLVPPTGVAARFEDDTFQVGRVRLKDRELVTLLNATDAPLTRTVKLARKSQLRDYWTGADLGTHDREYAATLPARSGSILEVRITR
jgi:alpha-galactosidase